MTATARAATRRNKNQRQRRLNNNSNLAIGVASGIALRLGSCRDSLTLPSPSGGEGRVRGFRWQKLTMMAGTLPVAYALIVFDQNLVGGNVVRIFLERLEQPVQGFLALA